MGWAVVVGWVESSRPTERPRKARWVSKTRPTLQRPHRSIRQSPGANTRRAPGRAGDVHPRNRETALMLHNGSRNGTEEFERLVRRRRRERYVLRLYVTGMTARSVQAITCL